MRYSICRSEGMMRLKGIQAVYPQCAECLYHFKSHKLLMNHMYDGVFTPKDVLSNAIMHANELVSRMKVGPQICLTLQ